MLFFLHVVPLNVIRPFGMIFRTVSSGLNFSPPSFLSHHLRDITVGVSIGQWTAFLCEKNPCPLRLSMALKKYFLSADSFRPSP